MNRRTFDPAAAKATPPMIKKADRACNGVDGEVFFPTHASGYRAAVALCHTCPYEQMCLSWALSTWQSFGVWGGKTPDERDQMLTGKRAA